MSRHKPKRRAARFADSLIVVNITPVSALSTSSEPQPPKPANWRWRSAR
jgi:hypothetical protein